MHMGMAHRGRLNILHSIFDKPMAAICSEMEGEQSEFGVGDIKYHLGTDSVYAFDPATGRRQRDVNNLTDEIERIKINISPNPSHLEAVNPCVQGIVRAEQGMLRDDHRHRVCGLLIHGDAAFSGLGCVHEALQLSKTAGFKTGGTIHLVCNNQLGFTTVPYDGRSCDHPTDVAKICGAPIIHANADDPLAVDEACTLAAEWRFEFGTDVVVDLVGYRRHGHNELDDQSTTLPLTSEAVKEHPPVLTQFIEQLLSESIITEDQMQRWSANIAEEYERAYEEVKLGMHKEDAVEYMKQSWQGEALLSAVSSDDVAFNQEPTGVHMETLRFVGEAISTVPPDFTLHPDVARLLRRRGKMVASPDSKVDWAMAEALALGVCALHRDAGPVITGDGGKRITPTRGHYSVRLTGQDVERGTFNQRYAVLYDVTGQRFSPLNNIQPGGQADVEVFNSPLAEASVLGFEYGMSVGYQGTGLVLWEAQFGDFANSAQVIIDQFLSCGEERWNQLSNLVVLLPHGYDGQGPDHSSARLERFLQLAKDDPDALPGRDPASLNLIEQTFQRLVGKGDILTKSRLEDCLMELGMSDQNGLDEVFSQMDFDGKHDRISRFEWQDFMQQYLSQNMEQEANIFVANCTTPANYFHILRRQLNKA